jgi:transposase-like protein
MNLDSSFSYEARAIEFGMRAVSGRCVRCGSSENVRRVPHRTCYADPAANHDEYLCPPCTVEFHEYWDEMWSYVGR